MKKWWLAEAKKLSLDLSNRRSDALRGDPSASPQDTSLSGRNCGTAFGRPFGFSRQELAIASVKGSDRASSSAFNNVREALSNGGRDSVIVCV